MVNMRSIYTGGVDRNAPGVGLLGWVGRGMWLMALTCMGEGDDINNSLDNAISLILCKQRLVTHL
jgi:hypothetical protein